MPIQTRTYLKSKFETGDIPTEQDFIDLFDSYMHLTEDVEQTTGSSTTKTMSQDAITQALAALGGGVVIHITYADIAAMLADQANQDVGKWYMASDASASPDVDSGWAIYQKLASTTATLATDYIKIAEQESLDVIVTNASETVKGIVEEATDTEVTAGTATGATGAKLFITPAKLLTWWNAIKAAAITFTSWVKGKQFVTEFQTLTDAATIAWDANSGAFAQVTLGGNRTLGAVTNMQTGGLFILRVIQDGTGGRTLAFNAQYTFPGSVTPILNSAAGDATVLVFFYDGSNMRYCNASGDYKLANLYLSAQAAAGSDQRPLYIDSTGKVFKSAFVNFDETNKKVVVTGNGTSTTTVFEILNSALSSIMKLTNDQVAEFGGSTGVISILSSVVSGGAYIEVNSDQSEAFKVIDKAANTYMTVVSTTGGLTIKTHQRLINDQGVGFERVTVQAYITTTTTAAATNLISFVALATDTAIDITVNHLNAYQVDGGAYTVANGGRKGSARNAAGTVSGAFDTFSMLSPSSETATWSLVADNTNKRININFINNSGTGKLYEVALDFSYVLRVMPTS